MNPPGATASGAPGGHSTSIPETDSPCDHSCNHDLDLSSGHSLGRDDALWPCYVQEAEKWDGLMMDKWKGYVPDIHAG